jgi:hypothetical protein
VLYGLEEFGFLLPGLILDSVPEPSETCFWFSKKGLDTNQKTTKLLIWQDAKIIRAAITATAVARMKMAASTAPNVEPGSPKIHQARCVRSAAGAGAETMIISTGTTPWIIERAVRQRVIFSTLVLPRE